MQGEWQGVCLANGTWNLDMPNMTRHTGALAGAQQPGAWSAIRGTAVVSPTLGSTAELQARIWLCDPFHAPCMVEETDGDVIASDGNDVYGEFLDPTGTDVLLQFNGVYTEDDDEIEGSCYNRVDGGAGVITLTR